MRMPHVIAAGAMGGTLALALGCAAASAPPAPPQGTPERDDCNTFRIIPITIEPSHLSSGDAPDIKKLVTGVCREDMVGWHFINKAGTKVDIEVSDFVTCDTTKKKVDALKFKGGFFDDDSDGSVAPNRSLTLVGRVRGGGQKCVDYTIRFNGVVHDPRLEIADPGT